MRPAPAGFGRNASQADRDPVRRGFEKRSWRDWLLPPIAVPMLLIVIAVAYGVLR